MERELDGVINHLNDTRRGKSERSKNRNGQRLFGLLVGGYHKRSSIGGMLKQAAFVVPAAGAVGGTAKAYKTLLPRNALLRPGQYAQGSTAYDRADPVRSQITDHKAAQASQKEAQ